MRYKIVLVSIIAFIAGVFVINSFITTTSNKYIFNNVNDIPHCYTAIVLGTLVSQTGYLSDFLQDRLDAAIELYKNGQIHRFLLSGDHGQKDYDEVNAMKAYLLNKGIKTEDIFLDHAGFDTYSTMVRAKKVFLVDETIVVTQKFHLPRAIYLARANGLKAYGYIADKRMYSSQKRLEMREYFANIKAFIEVLISKRPRFLGNSIPITGDSRLSYD